jgi:hypothetical protein
VRQLVNAIALVVIAACVNGCGKQPEGTAEPSPPSTEQAAAPAAPPPRRTLPNAEPAAPAALALDQMTKVDLAAGIASGETTIAVEDARFQASVSLVVDGNVDSFAVTNGVNPAEVTITLSHPIKLRAVRVYPIASPYDWAVEATPGGKRWLVEGVPERTWSQIDLPAAVETSVVRLEILRRERDDYVHVGEIELYAEPK